MHTNKIKLNLNTSLSPITDVPQGDKTVARAIVLLQFLKDNHLLNFDPFDKEGQLKEKVIVKESNLTNGGLLLFKSAVPKWYSYIHRGGEICNTEILATQLKKIKKTTG